MIAGEKSFLRKLDYREDYGVDIGMLIDMHLLKLRIRDIEIGYIENKSKPWQELGKMSKEVAQAIISKGATTKKPPYFADESRVHTEIPSQMGYAIKNHLRKLNKLIVFDMIKEAGIGIAFCSNDELLKHHADVIISTPSFAELLNHTSFPQSKSHFATNVQKLTSNISKRGSDFFQILTNTIQRISKR